MKNSNSTAPIPDRLDEMLRQMDEALSGGVVDSPPLHEDPLFLQEKMKIDFLEDVHRAMDAEGINASELARRMGISRARVAKILNETSNFQMETMAKIAAALRRQVTIRLHSQEAPKPLGKKSAPARTTSPKIRAEQLVARRPKT